MSTLVFVGMFLTILMWSSLVLTMFSHRVKPRPQAPRLVHLKSPYYNPSLLKTYFRTPRNIKVTTIVTANSKSVTLGLVVYVISGAYGALNRRISNDREHE